MIVLRQAKFYFQLFTHLAQGLVIVVRLVKRVATRVYLVDGDVNVQVVRVVMHSADALMIAVAQCSAQACLDGFQARLPGLLASAKAHDQVVRPVRSGPGVLCLGIEDFEDGCVHLFPLVDLAVRDAHAAHAFVLVLCIGDVFHQAGEVAFLHRLHGNLLGNHGALLKFLAAKNLTARTWASPRRA